MKLIQGNELDGSEYLKNQQKYHRRGRSKSVTLTNAPKNKQITKHEFMKKIVEESIPELRKALINIHRWNRNHMKLWDEMNDDEKRKNKQYLKWTKPMTNSQVRLAKLKPTYIPERLKRPDMRKKENKKDKQQTNE